MSYRFYKIISSMKNLFLISLILLFTLLIPGCSSDNDDDFSSGLDIDLDQIKERGKLVALTGFNAYSYFIYKGQPMGFEYELLTRLAGSLEVELEIKIVREMEKMFEMLNEGEGDLIAFNLTVTKERAKKVNFTHYNNQTVQVLVQRRPENWRQMKLHQIEKTLIRNPIDLIDTTIYVRKASSYTSRLRNLSEEIGGDINIVEASPELATEDLIRMVAKGEIDLTVADENIAKLYQAFYSILNVDLKLSLPQRIAWAVRKDSPELLAAINNWLVGMKKKTDYYVIYDRYYRNRSAFKRRVKSEYFSLTGGKISKYDDEIKKYSKTLNWDWRLLASLIYQESQFKTNETSWAGAQGLMQLMPATAERYGVTDLNDPHQSLKAGIKYLKWLDGYWSDDIPDSSERTKFVMASYNIGPGHVVDARRLAEKYGADPNIWYNNVETYLLKKSEPKYYNDEIVKLGYSRGVETVNYVREVLDRYGQYKILIAKL